MWWIDFPMETDEFDSVGQLFI
uniref:Uncharacterized protein n=1 Tax=Rhizophora mucronata TaxID=61149 RepID=A0A2P2N844_RHIMU